MVERPKNPIDVAVVYATRREAKPFVALSKATLERREPYFVHTFVLPESSRSSVVLSTGIGPFAAAVALRYMFLRYVPRYVVNVGLVGSLVPDLSMGDLIEIDSVCKKNLGKDLAEEEIITVQTGLCAEAMQLSLVTVDKPVQDACLRDSLMREGHVVDMEGYAVAEACAAFAVPCFMLKMVSDNADAQAGKDFFRRCDEHSMRLAEHVYSAVGVLNT